MNCTPSLAPQLGVLETSAKHVTEDVRQLAGSRAARLILIPATFEDAPGAPASTAAGGAAVGANLDLQLQQQQQAVVIRSDVMIALLAAVSIRRLRAPVALLVAGASLPPALARVLVVVPDEASHPVVARLLLRRAASLAAGGAHVTAVLLLPPSCFSAPAPEPVTVSAPAAAAAAQADRASTPAVPDSATTPAAAPEPQPPALPPSLREPGFGGTLNRLAGAALARLARQAAAPVSGSSAPAIAAKTTATPATVLTPDGLARFEAASALATLPANAPGGGSISLVCRAQAPTDFGASAVVAILLVSSFSCAGERVDGGPKQHARSALTAFPCRLPRRSSVASSSSSAATWIPRVPPSWPTPQRVPQLAWGTSCAPSARRSLAPGPCAHWLPLSTCLPRVAHIHRHAGAVSPPLPVLHHPLGRWPRLHLPRRRITWMSQFSSRPRCLCLRRHLWPRPCAPALARCLLSSPAP